ncbi:MAG: chorismate synthase [Candidatus Altiarchaeota archaeon]
MNGNSFGNLFRITSFGESHGRCVGIVVDGCPAGLKISEEEIQRELDRRKPGQSEFMTNRKEDDKVEILSGVHNRKTTGAPICMIVRNKDIRPRDYLDLRNKPRPGHADFTSFVKSGSSDITGGGRFSGRITTGFVMAGAIAKKILAMKEIEISAFAIEIGGASTKKEMQKAIKKAKEEKDSVGGIIEVVAKNVPPGLGEPVFDTLEGDLAKAMFAIPGVKGVEFGSGFRAAKMKGSENNDAFIIKNGKVFTETNNAGGILGGVSNGMPIICRVAIKPTSSIGKKQKTVNLGTMRETTIEIKGRHDPCIVPRAIPVVESMMAIVLTDYLMLSSLIPRILK